MRDGMRPNTPDPMQGFLARNKIGISIITGFLGAQLIANSLYEIENAIIVTLILISAGLALFYLAGYWKPWRHSFGYIDRSMEIAPMEALPGSLPGKKPVRAFKIVCDVAGSVFIVSVLYHWLFEPMYISVYMQLLVGISLLVFTAFFATTE